MVLLVGCRDPQKVLHGSQRGKILAAGPRRWLGWGHRQEPTQPTQGGMQGEVAQMSCSLFLMCWIFKMHKVVSTTELSSVCFSNFPHLYF